MTTAALILLAIAAATAVSLADSIMRWTSAFAMLARELHR